MGSNTKGKAKAFACKWKIERAYENYDDLVRDPDMDIIYITTPNAFHLDHAKLAMEHGKNVLCEKPFALNGKAASEMKACAKANHVFLMEAMWTRCFPAVRQPASGFRREKSGRCSPFTPFTPFWPTQRTGSFGRLSGPHRRRGAGT